MDQKTLARMQLAAHHHIRPDGKGGFRQGGGGAQIQSARHRQRMIGGTGCIFGIAAAGQKRADAIARFPAGDARSDRSNNARAFQPRQV